MTKKQYIPHPDDQTFQFPSGKIILRSTQTGVAVICLNANATVERWLESKTDLIPIIIRNIQNALEA